MGWMIKILVFDKDFLDMQYPITYRSARQKGKYAILSRQQEDNGYKEQPNKRAVKMVTLNGS
jgi:hypothetical protein